MATENLAFNQGWLFHRGDIAVPGMNGFMKAGRWYQNGASLTLDDTTWKKVILPHDFMIETEFCRSTERFIGGADVPEMGTLDSYYTTRGSIPGGIGWYRKHFTLPPEAKGKRVYLRFDGVYRDSALYVNQYLCLKHLNGYLGFTADITDLVSDSGDNLIALRVDSTEGEGWWYTGGGIYRNVFLVIDEQTHIRENSLYVRQHTDIETKKAKLDLSLTVENHTAGEVSEEVTFSVLETEEITIGKITVPVTVPPMGEATARAEIELENIRLWDTENPFLYGVTAALASGASAGCRVGLRTVRLDSKKGFFLNDVPTKLRGVCVHQGHAGVGVAEFDGLHEYKLRKLRAMGANAYRTSHCPVSPALLDACDEVGILVLAETRLFSSSDIDREDFTQMILRDRNHPSIIMWSIGNEEPNQFTEYAGKIARTMTDIAHAIDPDRPVTEAILLFDKALNTIRTDVEITAPISENVDVIGLNYGLIALDKLHEYYPDKPFLSTEIRSIGGTRGIIGDDPERCHITPFYKKLLPTVACGEQAWKITAERDWMAGMFAWTGFDYYGEPTPFIFPAVSSQFGILDLCGFPKYGYYYFRNEWRQDVKTFALCPHWNPAIGGERRTVFLFGDCDEAELFVGDVSLGRKPKEKHGHIEWNDVEYVPGKITVIGYRDGKAIARDEVVTTGAPARLCADLDHVSVDCAGTVYAIVHLYTVDDAGRTVPTADNRVAIRPGDGVELVGSGNGDPSCLEPPTSKMRALFSGHAQVILRRDRSLPGGKATFAADGLSSAEIEF